ncbi:putative protein kinase RLK-Pelle-CrRLK1L-1 family [Helianthus annuus]|nr:putative protein kinase RLK-Pelle-CrRLK1L-1 family [Helianthus annuus]KAJ0624987.1 putative protein kinase RLK-Pelle-CrRLK1L-1 family [Helianthus annuus]KAJ0638963.1 putative protein kinase RLK-Pelle-CrRLK1L-1 family [Helianthus annuus]KAJ0638964.1 putative protein kinase RLK-Pelle-CrRLK1L-1 family [Helianthus annuus]KAJ0735459.1 putative protein kinase RLK-Pelle-CrRLK1L-1 family [Helianthus annuus]
MDIVRISLEDIKYATDNFSEEKCIGRGAFGKLFKGQLRHANGHKIIAAKRLNTMNGEGVREFFRELEILLKFTHRNVIGLEGYCDEMGEKIIVYEYAPNSSLNNLLKDASLTWKKRLEIGIDVASGLDFLHGGVLRQEMVLHRDMKSSNILLDRNWKAKIANFELSLISPNNQDTEYVIEEDPAGTAGYIDPAYLKTHTLSKAADIYSFGVVLFEILCGRLAIPTGVDVQDKEQYLGPLAKNFHEKNKLEELVFEGIKEQIVPLSLSTFAKVAYNCLNDDRSQRPTASEVVVQLKKALEFHVSFVVTQKLHSLLELILVKKTYN